MARARRCTLLVTRDSFGDPPWLDTAVSWALLERASEGRGPGTLRLFRPAPVVAFGPADRLLPGYAEARHKASRAGFAPIDRLAGGRAAVLHEGTIAFSWTVPDPRARAHIHERFNQASALVAEALCALGLDAQIGAIPGEYCPGAYSVSARGRTKIAGLGQRVFPHAAHVGGMVAIEGGARIREVLVPVYAALGLAWNPASASSLRDEGLTATFDEAVEALITAARGRFDVVPTTMPREVVEQALAMAPRFEAPEDTRITAGGAQ